MIRPTDEPTGNEGIGNPDPPFGPGPDDEGIGNIREEDPDRDHADDLPPGAEMGTPDPDDTGFRSPGN
jgi:hypothetical protein